MKIAVISMIRNPWGGSEELWYEMAKTAIAQGHEVIHLSYENKFLHPKLKELIALGLISMQRPGITNSKLRRLRKLIAVAINYLRKKIQKPVQKLFDLHPDVVIYNGTCYSMAAEKSLLESLNSFKGNFFLLGHYNDKMNLSANDVVSIKKAYKKAQKIFFTNNADINTAKKDLGYDIVNATIVRNPVNMKSNQIIPFPSDQKVNMAIVANLITRHKGQDIVLNILKNKNWRERNWVLNIYGSGPDDHFLKNISKEFNLEDRVFFHGKVDDIRALWERNHILLLPSRMEGMPLVVVEAMFCGRPVVATNVGGISEWIDEGISGFIAEKADLDSFEKALEKAWHEKEEWEKMGRQAHEKALLLYDPHPGKTLLELITK